MKNKIIILAIICPFFLLSCRGTIVDSSATDGTQGDASKDAGKSLPPDNSAGFNVSVQFDKNYSYVIHKVPDAGADLWDQPCRIDSVDRATKINCIVEAHELDLYFYGVGLRVNVPPNSCSYLVQRIPYFYQYLPGLGSGTYVDNTAGTAVNMGFAAGTKSPDCAFNYSIGGGSGPNCCIGTYTSFVFTDDPTAAPDKVTTTTNIDWGGKAANCLAGPGMDLAPAKTKAGYPFFTIAYVEGVGTNIGYFVVPPISKQLLGNIFASNYYNPADHGGDVPLFTRPPGFSPTQVTHQFDCLDRAREVLARIDVTVREWNLMSELSKGVAGDQTADPDSGGNETNFPSPNNDYSDLKDLGNLYPNGGL